MAKAKGINQAKKSPANTSILHLKKGLKLTEHDPFKALLDKKLIAQAFWDCLEKNDLEGAMEVLTLHVNALHKIQKIS